MKTKLGEKKKATLFQINYTTNGCHVLKRRNNTNAFFYWKIFCDLCKEMFYYFCFLFGEEIFTPHSSNF